MRNFMENAREEVLRLENALKKIDAFLSHTPEGCLKWQNKNGKTYYYHQFMKDAKWVRRYIKKGETSLARALAQKHYYGVIKPILERNLKELNRFLQKCPSDELEEVYDNLSVERKKISSSCPNQYERKGKAMAGRDLRKEYDVSGEFAV